MGSICCTWIPFILITISQSYQEKSQLLMSARFFSVISPAKSGCLESFYFWEVDLWLLKVRFCALSATFHHFLLLSALWKWSRHFLMHTGTGTIVLFLCHDSHDPLCLWIHVLCLDSSFVIIMSYRTFLSWFQQFCLLSAPLWAHCLHTPYCYLFLANWSVRCPALNFMVYN